MQRLVMNLNEVNTLVEYCKCGSAFVPENKDDKICTFCKVDRDIETKIVKQTMEVPKVAKKKEECEEVVDKKVKAVKIPYWKTEKGKAAAKRYRESAKGKEAAKRFRDSKKKETKKSKKIKEE